MGAKAGTYFIFKNDFELNEYVKCREDVSYFARTYCKIYHPRLGQISFDLYDFQEYVLWSWKTKRLNILKKPRQMGITWLGACRALHKALFFSNKNVLIISIKEKLAVRFMHRIRYMFKNLPDFLRKPIVNGKRGDFGTKTEIEFIDNSRIESIPSSEDAGRSEGASLVIIDEAAFIEHMEQIWSAIQPTLSTGGEMLVFSTTNGIGNRYHKLYVDARSGNNSFNYVDLTWMMHPDRDMDWYEMQKRDLGERLCAQEVDCDFLTSGDNVFDLITLKVMEDEIINEPYSELTIRPFYDYVRKFEILESSQWKKNPHKRKPKHIKQDVLFDGQLKIYSHPVSGKRYILGVDTAKGKAGKYDNSTVVVLEYDTLDTVFEYCGRIKLDLLPTLVVRAGEYYNISPICIENTGIGIATVKGVKDLGYPMSKIYSDQDYRIKKRQKEYENREDNLGWSSNVRSKPLLIEALYDAIQDWQLVLKSFRAIYEFQAFISDTRGNMEAAEGYNDDLVIGYGLALQAGKMYRRTSGLIVQAA